MHHIASVTVEGFWETYDFQFDVHKDTTFFIGQNGTGKTTLINLIAAALTADFRTLNKIPFDKITIYLRGSSLKSKPYISVSKVAAKKRPVGLIEYRVLSGAPNAKEIRYQVDETEEEFLYRRSVHYNDPPLEYYRRMRTGLIPELRSLFSVNWLSIHRANSLASTDKQFESTVDKKIDSLSNDLVRYFSSLSKRKDDEIRLFQESIFVSLLETSSSFGPVDIRIFRNLDEYQNTLQNIFNELHVSNHNSAEVINAFISRAKSLSDNLKPQLRSEPDLKALLDDAVFHAGFKKIESIVNRWDQLQEKLNEIFFQRDKFLDIVNNLLQRKKVEVTETNELSFRSRSGKNLTPYMLSSGEKQLLILLSETLLQREEMTIFIADEPELSLHVLWQEALIGSLNALNPNAQILVATHSPDIVGPLEDRAIDMETLIQ